MKIKTHGSPTSLPQPPCSACGLTNHPGHCMLESAYTYNGLVEETCRCLGLRGEDLCATYQGWAATPVKSLHEVDYMLGEVCNVLAVD